MKYLVAAFAVAIATPAAAQQQPAPQGHGQHGPAQHQSHGQGQHQGHGQQGQAQHQGHGQNHGGHGSGESCPCCAPGPNGQRPACCERMHQQGARPDGGHNNH